MKHNFFNARWDAWLRALISVAPTKNEMRKNTNFLIDISVHKEETAMHFTISREFVFPIQNCDLHLVISSFFLGVSVQSVEQFWQN